MRRFVQRFPSLVARNLIHHPPTILRHPKINPRAVIVPSLFFSSESGSDDVVSKEELKNRIQSFLEDGDEDALPDLFEAMMKRKMSGMHDESDDEVMEEVRKYPINNKVDDDNVESGDGDSSDSDVESDDLSDDGDSSDSDDEIDIEIEGLRDGDSSDSDMEFDGLKDVDLSGRGLKIDGLKDVGLSGLDVKMNGLKDVDLSGLDVKIDGLKRDHSSYSDSESD